jgi:acyl carrier protein
MADIAERLKGLFISVLGVDEKEFGIGKTHDDFEKWDSLSHMSIVSAIEEEFKISLDVDEISEMDTIKKMIDTISSHTKAGAG